MSSPAPATPRSPNFALYSPGRSARNGAMTSRWPVLVASLLVVSAATAAEIRLGIIGLDTSHVTAFTEILNNPAAKDHVAGAKVVAAFKGGSPDIESSWSRVEEYTKTLREKHGVTIHPTVEALCKDVDAVLIESVDGRPHLGQVKAVIAAGKPFYVDKPLGGSLKDAVEILRLAKAAKIPMFSASSLRFAKGTLAVRAGAIGTVTHAWCGSPAHLEKTHPDLYWYGVHGCESLFTVLGTGCISVRRGTTQEGKIEVVGRWSDGRTGTFREVEGYQGEAWGTKGSQKVGSYDGYAPLVAEIVKFFQTGVAPVGPGETLEIMAFMEAADESKRRGGTEVTLAEVLKKAGAGN